MSYSPDVEARLNAEAAQERTSGPSFPMPRLRHNGETGEWLIRELDDKGKLLEGVKPFEAMTAVDSATGKVLSSYWRGVVLRVAWMAQTKYKEGALFQKMTREFTDFKTEPIELMKRVFGPAGKTESLKTFANYQDFKFASQLKDEEGNAAGSAYDLKVCLYVYNFERKQVIKIVFGGSARSEWFEYMKSKPSGDEGIVSVPWMVSQRGAKILGQIMTEFYSEPAKTDKGLEYHRLSFRAIDLLNDEQLKASFEQKDKITAWVEGWKAFNTKDVKKLDALAVANAQAPMPSVHERLSDGQQEINSEDIPF